MPIVLAAIIGVLAGVTVFGIAVAAFVGTAVPTVLGVLTLIVATAATATKLKAASAPKAAAQ